MEPSNGDETSLHALEARVRQDMDDLCRPAANWVVRRTQGGAHVHDVVIIGGGMCGMLVWNALESGGIRNTRIVDKSCEGVEGPWLSYARMETLRSPKQLTGPANGMASLTFRAWYRASFGEAQWQALDKIPRPMWMDYLRWYRKVLNIPIENEVEVKRIEPEGEYLKLTLEGRKTAEPSILARRVVMATGRDGTGRPNIPTFMDGVARNYWAHSADKIDFKALKDKRIAVVGVGASAVDNAAEALEAGAAEVRLLIRRKEMPTVNKMMGIGSFGFTCGYATLLDEWRWRFMQYSFATQTPAPHGSTKRVSRHKNAYFHFGKAVSNVRLGEDELEIDIADGSMLRTEFLILGTGFTTDPMLRTEFGEAAGAIRLWQDAYRPPENEANPDLSQFPYLSSDFTFQEKIPGKHRWFAKVHCFNYGATASLGKVSGDIPGISDGAAWLARDIAAKLYAEDIETHWQDIQDYAKPELLGDEWEPSDMPDARNEKPGAKRQVG